MTKHIGALFALCLLIVVGSACNGSFTTANISKLEFGKSEKAEPAATSFDIDDTIYAVATVSNTSEKLKMSFKVTYENVSGKQKDGEALEKSIDFEGSRPVWLSFTVPAPGEYKVEATLSDESGKKIDSKSGNVTVTGSAPPAH